MRDYCPKAQGHSTESYTLSMALIRAACERNEVTVTLLSKETRELVYPLSAPSSVAKADARLILVSNRLPITLSGTEGGACITPSDGGLATALRRTHARGRGLWIGWTGVDEERESALPNEVLGDLAGMRLVPVPLSAREIHSYYDRLCNAVLWPICHDRLDQLPLHVRDWHVYEEVNARFAEAVAAQYRPGDVIWVHDYHLMRLPALLRERLPDAQIGFFLHVPFPNPEIFFALSNRRWLVEGLLGADLIGFHTR